MDPLIASMYQAAADERHWPQVLAEMDAALGTVASWQLVFRERVVLGVWATGALQGLASRAMSRCLASDLWEERPSLAHCLAHPTQAFADFADYFPPDVVARDSMLQAMVHNGLHHVTGAVLHVPGGVAVLNLCRPSAAPLPDADLERLDALHPHWAQAMQLCVLLGHKRAQRLSDTLQNLDEAAAVLSHQGAVMARNAQFERYLPDWGELDGRQHLRARDPAYHRQLARALALPEDVAPAPLALATASGRPLQLQITHLGGATRHHFLDGRKLVVVRPANPGGTFSAPSRERLQAQYGLTAREADLSLLLAAGNTLRQAATGAGLTYASARTYLDRVYGKTGARRQVDLVRQVLGVESTQAAAPPPRTWLEPQDSA